MLLGGRAAHVSVAAEVFTWTPSMPVYARKLVILAKGIEPMGAVLLGGFIIWMIRW